MTEPVDVHQRVTYGRHKLHRKRLLLVVAFALACLLYAYYGDHQFLRPLLIVAGILSIPWAAYETYMMVVPSPLLELLPQGIIFREVVDDFIVPWDQVLAVDSITVHAEVAGRSATLENVTAITVSKFFYDRVIHADWYMRGPGWENVFIAKGDRVQIAMHHEILPVKPGELRRQVEARWRAFGKAPPGSHRPVGGAADS
jgi:hypothetical protein